MSAIEATLARSKKILELVENKINNHFHMVDTGENGNLDPLRVSNLGHDIAQETGYAQAECVRAILTYIGERPELEERKGKNGGIWRVGEQPSTKQMTVQECAMRHYEIVKTFADEFIDQQFSKEEEFLKSRGQNDRKVVLNIQELCETAAMRLDVKSYVVYHCLKHYIKFDRKDLRIDLGRRGGLSKIVN